MAIHAQSSCTLSTITDVEAVYTYYYLSDSTITTNEAPKDGVNPPGASTITVVSSGKNYVWQITEPQLDIQDDVIQTAVGKLYYIECVKFSDGTYDWGPLMTSSTYAAAKAAYNLSSQALTQATAANNATALLGGHFIYNTTWSTSKTPHSANVVQNIGTDGIYEQTPSRWEYNTHIGANGIKLRYNEIDLSSWTDSGLIFYNPSNSSQGNKMMELSSSALKFFDVNDSTNPLMSLSGQALNFYQYGTNTAAATLNSNGLNLIKGGIKAGNDGQDGFVYLSSEDYPLRDFIKTEDVAIDDDKVYYIIDNYRYIAVTEPVLEDIENYYEVKSTASGIGINGHVPSKGITPPQETVLSNNNLTNNDSEDSKVNYDDPAWREVIGTKFGVDSEGNLYASNVDINGQITAISGAIGGWQIGTDINKSLYYEYNIPGASQTNLVLSPKSAENAISIGGSETNLTWFISVGNIFGVTTEGKLYSTSGRIGGWVIDANSLQSVSGSVGLRSTDTDIVFWAGASSSSANAPFRITKDGALYANDINFQSGGETIVSLVNRELRISSANIVNNLTLGQFKWIVDNNRLTLMRI